ncbi:DUF4386 domain-containing protein [Cellulomonas sp. URHD0024]|uniref:DUF4386 domain-containing protein n=1 Tax=Cellulomonas sp. URHD0024 TaxID=1302620 RepID=UPI000421AAAA|nr:DUF4386 domain-containing protein [Cellulomonas sp. URHD0024]
MSQSSNLSNSPNALANPRLVARVAAVFYLVVAIAAGWSQIIVRAGLSTDGSPAQTAQSIRDARDSMRLAFAADLTAFTCFMVTVVLLFVLFRRVNLDLAVGFLVPGIAAVVIQSLSMILHGGALLVATGKWPGSDETATLLLDMHTLSNNIAQIFFGLWLLPLGLVVIRSGYVPRVLGYLLMVGGLGYLIDILLQFAVGADPDSTIVFSSVGGVAEVVFLLWLLIRGVSVAAVPARSEPVPVAA